MKNSQNIVNSVKKSKIQKKRSLHKLKPKISNGISYDSKSDVLYIGVKKRIEEEFIEIFPGINVELDENGKVIGIEILNASKILKPIFSL